MIDEKGQEEVKNGAGPESPLAGENENKAPEPSVGELARENSAEDKKAAPTEESPVEKAARLEAQLIEANDQFLRKAADFENFRKRMIRERQEAVDYANQALLLDLIQIMDDFDRAIKAAESCLPGEDADPQAAQIPASVLKTFYEGVSMIEKRLCSQLENKWALKRFDSEGQPFDPNRHEAIMMEKSAEASEPVVQEEFYKGYTLKDRVVRSAKVKVLMPETP